MERWGHGVVDTLGADACDAAGDEIRGRLVGGAWLIVGHDGRGSDQVATSA